MAEYANLKQFVTANMQRLAKTIEEETVRPQYNMMKATAKQFIAEYAKYRTQLSISNHQYNLSRGLTSEDAGGRPEINSVIGRYSYKKLLGDYIINSQYQEYRQLVGQDQLTDVYSSSQIHELGMQLLGQVRRYRSTMVQTIIVATGTTAQTQDKVTFTLPMFDADTLAEKVLGTIDPQTLRMQYNQQQPGAQTFTLDSSNKFIDAYQKILAAAEKQDREVNGKKKTLYFYTHKPTDTTFAFLNKGDLSEALVRLLLDGEKSYSKDPYVALLYYASHINNMSGMFEGDIALSKNRSMQVKGNDARSMAFAQIYELSIGIVNTNPKNIVEFFEKMIADSPAAEHVAKVFTQEGDHLFKQTFGKTKKIVI